MFYYEAFIVYYDEMEGEEATDRIIVAGRNYGEAVFAIENCYGDTLISIKISATEQENVYVVCENDMFKF